MNVFLPQVTLAVLGHPDNLLKQVSKAVCEAGQKTMHFYQGDMDVTFKGDNSPLTAADRASHSFLLQALQDITPGIDVLSEESAEDYCGSVIEGKPYWLVDPLDGTKEFIKGTNQFTVNVALIESGQPVLGIVHAPALGVTYHGGRNSGAWRQTGSEMATPISTRRADPERMAVVASKDHAGPLVSAMLARLRDPKLQSMGSSLKFCLVAEGKADIYLRDLPTMEWDTAAAQCVVKAAGGGVYSLDGDPLRYGKPSLKNPAIMTVGDSQFDWRSLIDVVARVIRSSQNSCGFVRS
jgi:3'(2'), 5'-bisphosphate nucleotidase